MKEVGEAAGNGSTLKVRYLVASVAYCLRPTPLPNCIMLYLSISRARAEKKGKSVEKGEKSINQEGRQQLTYL